ncbi:MAG: hypothetical protein V1838_05730 [Patescibacteria group bacterium]
MSEGMLGNIPLSETRGPRDELDDRLAGKQGRMWLNALNKFLRRENPWGIPQIIEVTTNGRTGEQCFTDLEERSNRVSDYTKEALRSKEFVATDGTVYKLAVIFGHEFEDNERTNENIRNEAAERGYLEPPMEPAPYLRDMFSDEDLEKMGIWALVLMHKPFYDSVGDLNVLGVSRSVDGPWLDTFDGHPGDRWFRGLGFVFLVPASS